MALERVRAGADVMPRSQLEGVLISELGPEWHTRLAEFEWEPRAAASIGQVGCSAGRGGPPVRVCRLIRNQSWGARLGRVALPLP